MSPVAASLLTGLLVLSVGGLVRRFAIRHTAVVARRRLGAATPAPPLVSAGFSPPGRVRAALEAAGLEQHHRLWWTAWLAATVFGTIGASVAVGVGAGVVAVAVAVLVPVAGLGAAQGRGTARLEAELPPLLDEVARALRGGSSLMQALESAAAADGRLADELRRLVRSAVHAADLGSELRRWAHLHPKVGGLRLAAGVLALGAEAGGAQGRAVDGVAATLRDRAAVRAELSALTAQARVSAAVMGVTPLVFAALAALTDPRVGYFLLHTAAGVGCLLAGLVLNAAGLVWMLRITGRAA